MVGRFSLENPSVSLRRQSSDLASPLLTHQGCCHGWGRPQLSQRRLESGTWPLHCLGRDQKSQSMLALREPGSGTSRVPPYTQIPVLSDPLPPALSLGHLYKGSCATLPTMPAILQSHALKRLLAGWDTGPRQPELILEARMGTFPFSAKGRRNSSEWSFLGPLCITLPTWFSLHLSTRLFPAAPWASQWPYYKPCCIPVFQNLLSAVSLVCSRRPWEAHHEVEGSWLL